MKNLSIAAIALFLLAMAYCTKDSSQQRISPPAPAKENTLNITLHYSFGRTVTLDTNGIFCRYEDPLSPQSVIQIAGQINPKSYLEIILTNINVPGTYRFGSYPGMPAGVYADIILNGVGEQYQLIENNPGTLQIQSLTGQGISGGLEVMLFNYSEGWFEEQGPVTVTISGNFRGLFSDPSSSVRIGG